MKTRIKHTFESSVSNVIPKHRANKYLKFLPFQRGHAPYEFPIHKKDNSFKHMFWFNFMLSVIFAIIFQNMIIWLISAFIWLIISLFGLRNIVWYINTRLLDTGIHNKFNPNLKTSQNLLNHHNYFKSKKYEKKYYKNKYISNLKQAYKYLFYAFIWTIIMVFIYQNHADSFRYLIFQFFYGILYMFLLLPFLLGIILFFDSSKKKNIFYYLTMSPQYLCKIRNKIFFH